jgi:transposase
VETTLPTNFQAFMQNPELAFVAFQKAVESLGPFEKVKEDFERYKQNLEAEREQEKREIQAERVLMKEQLSTANKIAEDAMKVAEAATSELMAERRLVSYLKFQIERFKRNKFAGSSEKLSEAALAQLTLDIQAEEVATCSLIGVTDVGGYKKFTTITEPKKHNGRNAFPAHLRREDVYVEPLDKEDGDELIDQEEREVLEYNPGEVYVKRYILLKFAKKQKDGSKLIKIAEMPVQPIEKCIAGATLLAYIVVSKYIDSLLLYRQIEMFKRVGIEFPSSTVSTWIAKVCELLKPLYELLKKEVLKAKYLNVDETGMRVVEKGAKKGKAHNGFYWVYLHDWGKLVFYEYRPTREHATPIETLKDFSGHLQADGYEAYERVAERPDVTLICCMAHVRRKFNDIYKNNDKRAAIPLMLFNELYAIEEICREWKLSFEQIKRVRQEMSEPILDKLEAWLKNAKLQPDMDLPMRKAINYALNRWDKLRLYTSQGFLSIDNNAVERVIRTVAVGRKNYLFSGSHEGAQRSAMLYSLMASSKLNGLNPMEWLTDVLTRIAYLPEEYWEQLLPNNWQPAVTPGIVNQQILDK